MIRRIEHLIKEHDLFRPGMHVLVAVSGGADSVALLRALHRLAPSLGITLSIAHLNHGLRGKSAELDARFVRKLAKRLELAYTEGLADVLNLAKRGRISVEMAARRARYEFFAKTARQVNADAVATAHTADDQAETILLRLARGAGARGLAGIGRKVSLDGLMVIRPLLDLRRFDIEAFLKELGQAWRIDKTNLDSNYLRNRVRHEVLPFLETKLNPEIRMALIRTADILREEDAWMEELSGKILATCTSAPGTAAALLLAGLQSKCLAARRRVLRRWLSAAGVTPELIDFDALGRVDALLRPGGPRATEIAEHWVVKRHYDRLVVEQGRAVPEKRFLHTVQIPGDTEVAGQALRIVTQVKPGLVKDKQCKVGELPARASLAFSPARNRTVHVRSWREGDRMRPFGMKGSKKLHRIFIDAKVPAGKRSSIPVFECEGEIIWIPGYRVARGWEVTDPAAPALQIHVKRE